MICYLDGVTDHKNTVFCIFYGNIINTNFLQLVFHDLMHNGVSLETSCQNAVCMCPNTHNDCTIQTVCIQECTVELQ